MSKQSSNKQSLDAAYLRQQIVGVDSTFETPFGERLMVYCDYTASGRCLRFVESYLQSLPQNPKTPLVELIKDEHWCAN